MKEIERYTISDEMEYNLAVCVVTDNVTGKRSVWYGQDAAQTFVRTCEAFRRIEKTGSAYKDDPYCPKLPIEKVSRRRTH